ncbi:MAG: transposase [Candidatus Competibacteraceae bacterium]|nr:transposase [Candidatus Competibacteraceae bacterium]
MAVILNKKAGRHRGRPQSNRNDNRREITLSPYLQFVQGLLRRVLAQVRQILSVVYFVSDGAFGHNQALQMVRRTGLELIRKLRHNSTLYLPYAGRGSRRKYGRKLNYHHLPPNCLKATAVAGHLRKAIYLRVVWHQNSPTRSMS